MGSEAHGAHRQPPHVDEHASAAGLRTVAVFEASKGLLVLALAIVLIAVHHHLEDLSEELLYHLHVDFDRHWAQALMEGASKLSAMRIWTVVTVALAYTAVRFVEAWGLWHKRVWAEWFALLSGTLYLPLEVVQVVEHHRWEAIAILAINLAIVFYMLEIRVREMRCRRKEASIPQNAS